MVNQKQPLSLVICPRTSSNTNVSVLRGNPKLKGIDGFFRLDHLRKHCELYYSCISTNTWLSCRALAWNEYECTVIYKNSVTLLIYATEFAFCVHFFKWIWCTKHSVEMMLKITSCCSSRHWKFCPYAILHCHDSGMVIVTPCLVIYMHARSITCLSVKRGEKISDFSQWIYSIYYCHIHQLSYYNFLSMSNTYKEKFTMFFFITLTVLRV